MIIKYNDKNNNKRTSIYMYIYIYPCGNDSPTNGLDHLTMTGDV